MTEEDKAKLDELYAMISALSVEDLQKLLIETTVSVFTGEITEAQGSIIVDMISISGLERIAAQLDIADGAMIN